MDSPFDLNDFLPSLLFGGDPPPLPAKQKRGNNYRPPIERNALDLRLLTWLTSSVQSNQNIGHFTPYDILSHRQRVVLVRSPASLLFSADAITNILDESAEWKETYADSLFEVIRKYDADLFTAKKLVEDEEAAEALARATAKKKAADNVKAAKVAERKRQADEVKVAKIEKAVEKKRVADELRAEREKVAGSYK